MTTLNDFIDRVENAVNDATNTYFSAALVEEWIEDATREYSLHFPRETYNDITTSAGVRAYSLPADLQDVIHVIYPLGDQPDPFLTYLDRRNPHFYDNDEHYYWHRHLDAQATISIWISATPDAGETIRVYYLGDHDLDVAGGSDISVPGRHEIILVKYCVWKAVKYLEQAEEQDPTSNSSLLMAQMAQNAFRAERAYYDVLRRALAGMEGRSARATWQLDKYDRIY